MLRVRPRRNYATDTTRFLSDAVWSHFKFDEILRDPTAGFFHMEDFQYCPRTFDASGGAVTGSWKDFMLYAYQGGTMTDAGLLGGAVTIGSDGDNEGVALGPGGGGVFLDDSGTYGKCCFEVRLKTSTVTDTKHGIFAGLLETAAIGAAVPIATDGTIADKNCIGFWRREGDGDQFDFIYKADGQTMQAPLTDMISGGLAADTFVKLGFVFDPLEATAKRIKVYINNVEQSTYVTGTNIDAATFPDDAFMGLCLAVMNATGTTPGTTTVDWIAVGQLNL